MLIVDKCLQTGGDPAHNFFIIAQEIGVAHNSVCMVWREFCQRQRINPLPKGGDHSRKLSDGDLELIELLKRVKGSTQLSEIYSVLEEVGDVESISLSSISRAIKSKLLS
ncbi:Ankyrin repeat domain-containing 34B, partial [Paramuricea clavata]